MTTQSYIRELSSKSAPVVGTALYRAVEDRLAQGQSPARILSECAESTLPIVDVYLGAALGTLDEECALPQTEREASAWDAWEAPSDLELELAWLEAVAS